MNIKKLCVVLSAVFGGVAATGCSTEPVDQTVLDPVTPPTVVDPVVVPPPASDTVTVFVQTMFADQEIRTNAQLKMEQLEGDFALVPGAQVLNGHVAPAANATHKLEIVRNAGAVPYSQQPTELGGFYKNYTNTAYSGPLRHDNNDVEVYAYLSRNDHGIVAQGIKTNPGTGQTDTINAHVVKFRVAKTFKIYAAGPVDPLNPGTTMVTPLVLNTTNNKLGQQDRTFTFN